MMNHYLDLIYEILCCIFLLTGSFYFFILVALQALKRKKRYEQQLEQLHGTLTTIETQREALENANTNSAVLDTMKGAANALKKSHKDMDVDKVHDIMDDISEQTDIANEISNAISTGLVSPIAVDDDELAKELEELEQEGLDQELLNVGPAPTSKLPDVPSTDLPIATKDQKEKKKRELYFLCLLREINSLYSPFSRETTYSRRNG